jgi:multidrug transporter EmrE-like cation transporter
MHLIKPIFITNSIQYFNNLNSDFHLASSIILEVGSTLLLKKTSSNILFFLPIYTGYITSFTILPLALKKYSLTDIYAIWSGTGICLTYMFDIILFKEKIIIKKLFGILLILYGILFLN